MSGLVHFSGVKEVGNTIRFDDECMRGKLEKEVVDHYQGKKFDTIWVGYKKMYLGTILKDIVNTFEAPKTLELDLFYASQQDDGTIVCHDNLSESKRNVRHIFSKWANNDVEVIFKCNELVVEKFNLSGNKERQ